MKCPSLPTVYARYSTIPALPPSDVDSGITISLGQRKSQLARKRNCSRRFPQQGPLRLAAISKATSTEVENASIANPGAVGMQNQRGIKWQAMVLLSCRS
jgi:hypothetical protein